VDKIKALFLAANPMRTSRLGLDEEIRAITEKVRASQYRDALEFVAAWAVRPDDVLQALNTYQPQIVHFSRHGSSAGEILLVGADGSPKAVSTKALKAVFSTLKDNIRLVILNACYSRTQAEAIIEVIDCAVGMKEAIGDQAAVLFAASFYRAIGFGRSIQDAFDQGKAALLLEGIPEEDTPELLVRRGVSPASVVLLHPQRTQVSPPPGLAPVQQHTPGTYHTCVLSYATENQAFAEKLYANLQQQGVSCWFAPHDLRTGDKIRTQIYETISKNDKLLIVLSQHSIESLWVEEEVEAALDREHQQPGTLMLFPVRLDETVLHTSKAWAIAVRQRYISDFRQWNDETAYQRALQRLLRDLKA
jgi:hypothetical protein